MNPDTPALQRVRALLALMYRLICNPARIGELTAMCEEAEHLLARHLFEQLIIHTGREDLRRTHEPILRQRGARLDFSLRARPGALHPFCQIILAMRRARAYHRYGTAMGCRFRSSAKRTSVRRRNQRRRQTAIISRTRATCARPSHTPPRISAPP